METQTAAVDTDIASIPAEHRDAADRYIAAIVRTDPLTALIGQEYIAGRTAWLLDQFVENYGDISRGPYARHGPDALRIALASL